MIEPLLKGAISEVKEELKKKDDRRLEELKKNVGELKSQNKEIIT
ncbi:MAG: hypothetical protein ABSB40_11465 [Nitrososphaeria archaeon]|jgi:hypothetical protein